jgi:transcriptional regulator NrdR family protein
VGGLAALNPYDGGSLHLQSGLFVGQLTEVDPVLSDGLNLNPDAPGDDPTLCPDDFFHVAGNKADEPATPESHKIYAVTKADPKRSVLLELTEMTPYLTQVARDRKVTGHNVESWVRAVESKLADIGILTILEVVAAIPTINLRLHQAGHVQLFTRTLHVMNREAVKAISVNDESASAYYNNHRMRSFLERVAVSKGVTGKSIDSWVETVHAKLGKVGTPSVRSTVSSLVLLNKKLFAAGLPLMHADTIEVMAREGANALSIEALESIDGWEVDLHEVPDGACENCGDTGVVGEPCATCTTESHYLNFHAGL